MARRSEHSREELREMTLAAALRIVDATGRWLAAGKKRWPKGAAETFGEVTARRGRIREALSKLSWPASG